jgi:hypothetical protein
MIVSLEQAVETRNYLAHHFLREYVVVAPSRTSQATGNGEIRSAGQARLPSAGRHRWPL